jgi:hypothetical protein
LATRVCRCGAQASPGRRHSRMNRFSEAWRAALGGRGASWAACGGSWGREGGRAGGAGGRGRKKGRREGDEG